MTHLSNTIIGMIIDQRAIMKHSHLPILPVLGLCELAKGTHFVSAI